VNVSASPATVYELLDVFGEVADDRLGVEFQRLVGALWRDGTLAEAAHLAVPALVARMGEVDDRRKGYLAVLLGLLAEAEYPATDGPVGAAISGGLDIYLGLLDGLGQDDPLCLALCYLLAHLPSARDRVLLAGRDRLGEDDRSRLDRALAVLDPARPVLGRVFPSPYVWELAGAGQDFDQRWISTLSPEQVLRSWQADTRTVLGSLGAKAHWAVTNWTAPARLPAVTIPPRDRIPRAADPADDIFGPHAAALRCPACGGGVEFGSREARCGQCAVTYPIRAGIVDLTAPAAGDQADDFQFMLAEMPSMGLIYETHARPNFLRLCGSNWGDAVTPATEDDYIARHVCPVDGPVLDIGAGAGRWTETLAKTVGGHRVITLDLNPSMLAMSRARLPRVPAIRAGAAPLPFNDASLGAALCWNALQAFPAEAPATIAEVGRCLRPNGTFTLMTYRNSDDPVYRHFVDSHTFSQYSKGPQLFDLGRLKELLADAGLRVREEWYPGTFVFITAEKR
jgi:SAM-dependent methyltransferase